MGFGPGRMPDPYPIPWTVQSSILRLLFAWFYAISGGGSELSGPINSTAALSRGREKVSPCPAVVQQSPNKALDTVQECQ